MSKKRKPYFERNHNQGSFLPTTIYNDWVSYLQKTCPGESYSAMFLMHVCKVLELYELGINPWNPIKQHVIDKEKELIAKWGSAKPQDLCIRGLSKEALLPPRVERTCAQCKIMRPDAYIPCQEEKKGLTEIRKKDSTLR